MLLEFVAFWPALSAPVSLPVAMPAPPPPDDPPPAPCANAAPESARSADTSSVFVNFIRFLPWLVLRPRPRSDASPALRFQQALCRCSKSPRAQHPRNAATYAIGFALTARPATLGMYLQIT